MCDVHTPWNPTAACIYIYMLKGVVTSCINGWWWQLLPHGDRILGFGAWSCPWLQVGGWSTQADLRSLPHAWCLRLRLLPSKHNFPCSVSFPGVGWFDTVILSPWFCSAVCLYIWLFSDCLYFIGYKEYEQVEENGRWFCLFASFLLSSFQVKL